jgi:hypothetical protein
MEKPIVQVVGPTDNWVLQKLARTLVARLPYAASAAMEPKRSAPAGIAYYVNYALYQGATSFIDVGFFTHLEESHDFLGRAHDIDWCVCMSKKYADWLREQGVEHGTRHAHSAVVREYYRSRPRRVLGVLRRLNQRLGFRFVVSKHHEGHASDDEVGSRVCFNSLV